MTSLKQPLAYGTIYMALSMSIEIVLLVVVRLKIPQDNAIIAPTLLIVSPVAAALICGYRRPKSLILVAATTVFLTLAFVMVFGHLTGISTGIVPPVVLRTLAGMAAGALTNRVANREEHRS